MGAGARWGIRAGEPDGSGAMGWGQIGVGPDGARGVGPDGGPDGWTRWFTGYIL